MPCVCNHCGEEFQRTPGAAGKFCSSGCYEDYKKEERRTTCNHCGETWVPDPTGGDKYCSQSCYHEHRRENAESQPTLTCNRCEKTFKPTKNSAGEFCSQECSQKTKSEYHEQKRPTVECEQCESEFEVKPHREKKARFCSQECKGRYYGSPIPSKKHPTLVCEWCGSNFKVTPARAESSRFCSKGCQNAWQSETKHGVDNLPDPPRGEDHPWWNGGECDHYGENWLEQRKKTRERDDHSCRYCGKHRSELGQEPDVHHIIPRKKFDVQNEYEEMNALDNLICLCKSCHPKWEGVPLRPQPAQ